MTWRSLRAQIRRAAFKCISLSAHTRFAPICDHILRITFQFLFRVYYNSRKKIARFVKL